MASGAYEPAATATPAIGKVESRHEWDPELNLAPLRDLDTDLACADYRSIVDLLSGDHMSAAAVLTAARHSRGLSQRALASRAGDHQPTISALEKGEHSPGLEHLSRLLAATGHRLVALPTTSRPVYEAAAAITAALRRGDESGAYREFIQLSDDLARESGPLRAALTALAPTPIDSRYDALLAAVAEHYMLNAGLAAPPWVHDQSRVLTDPWFVDDVPAVFDKTVAETPSAFARHGVFLAASELASV